MDEALKAEFVRQITIDPFNSGPVRHIGPMNPKPVRPIQRPIIRGK